MIRLSVLYPATEGARFDKDYYIASHIPLCREKLGDALRGVSVAFGVSGAAPGSPAPYVCIAHLDFDSVESFQQAFMGAAPALGADLKNYSDIQAVVQVSEVA